jgi:hypothetical protein
MGGKSIPELGCDRRALDYRSLPVPVEAGAQVLLFEGRCLDGTSDTTRERRIEEAVCDQEIWPPPIELHGGRLHRHRLIDRRRPCYLSRMCSARGTTISTRRGASTRDRYRAHRPRIPAGTAARWAEFPE